jgi:hypothetical protein
VEGAVFKVPQVLTVFPFAMKVRYVSVGVDVGQRFYSFIDHLRDYLSSSSVCMKRKWLGHGADQSLASSLKFKSVWHFVPLPNPFIVHKGTYQSTASLTYNYSGTVEPHWCN